MLLAFGKQSLWAGSRAGVAWGRCVDRTDWPSMERKQNVRRKCFHRDQSLSRVGPTSFFSEGEGIGGAFLSQVPPLCAVCGFWSFLRFHPFSSPLISPGSISVSVSLSGLRSARTSPRL